MDPERDEPRSLIRKIRSEDAEERGDGWAIISDELVGYAKSRTAGRDRVNAQAESIVQSVLKDLFDDVPSFQNDDHLIGHLKRRVANKLRQRVDPRAGANKRVDPGEAGAPERSADDGPRSLGSVIAGAEEIEVRRHVLNDVLAALRERLSPEDWLMVRARAIDGKSWAQLAESLGKSEQALRVRWFRLKPRIEEALAQLPDD